MSCHANVPVWILKKTICFVDFSSNFLFITHLLNNQQQFGLAVDKIEFFYFDHQFVFLWIFQKYFTSSFRLYFYFGDCYIKFSFKSSIT
jgi:hypothetical protein